MAKNVYSLQLLRNGTPFTSYTEAVAGIQAAATQDGVLKLARYTQAGSDPYSGDTGGHIKTIFAFRHEVGGESGYTIYEDYKEVVDVIKAKIDSMTGEGSGSIYDQIMTELKKLDYSGVTTGDGVVVTNVTETDGKVSATAAEVGSLKLTDYEKGSDTDDVAATDTINQAFAKLQNQIDELSGSTDDAIEALDAVITAADGSYIDKVEQVDGKISGTTKELPTVAEISEAGKPIVAVSETKGAVSAATGTINAEFVNVADADNKFTASTVEGALAELFSGYVAGDTAIVGGASPSANTLAKLETLINEATSDAKSYSIAEITGDDLTNLGANVREAYKLVDEDGVQSGATIKIYKDQTLSGASFSGQELTLTYILADGSTTAVSVDMHDLIEQTEFASGVTWDATASKVRGVVDSTSETFLTVGANGFKLAGVQAAIDAASGDVKSKLDELSGKTNTLSGKTVTSIASADGSVTATPSQAADGTVSYDLSTDASKVKVSSAYAAGSNAPIATGDTLDVALAKLEKQVAAANASVQKDANATHLTVTTGTGLNGETIYTIGENDIASARDLTDEIAARKAVDGQSGQTYAANTSANYISGATSLNDADVKLDAALKTVADSANSAQAEIDAIETAVGLNADGTHKVSTGNYTSNADSIEGEIVALDAQVKTNTDAIDALEDAFVSGATMNGTAVVKANNTLAFTAAGKQTAATATNNEAIVVETDANGGLTLGIASLDAGTY